MRKVFVALMSVRDYVHMLYLTKAHNLPASELPSRSILHMLHPSYQTFLHSDFQPVDAEDTVYQLCLQFLRSNVDYIPVVDPDNGNLVAVLGHLDILFLLSQISQEYPNLFAFSIEELGIGNFRDITTVPVGTKLMDVMRVMDERRLKCVPVVHEDGKLLGLYKGSSIAFITKSADPDVAIGNFAEHCVGDVVGAELYASMPAGSPASAGTLPLLSAGSPLAGVGIPPNPMGPVGCQATTCTLKYSLKSVIESMIMMRACAISCVDAEGLFLGIVTARDILHYYCHS